MTEQRQRDLQALSKLCSEKTKVERRIRTLRARLVRLTTLRARADEKMLAALEHGPLPFLELVHVAAVNRNTAKSALRIMLSEGRLRHHDGKYWAR